MTLGQLSPGASEDELDAYFMGLALEEARCASEVGDVPVGAVIIDAEGKLLARGRNRRELDGDPTAHAEVDALRRASELLGHWRVEGTMYVTLEPCLMCAGALVNARMSQVVFGALDPKAGALTSLYRISEDARLNHRFPVRGGVRGDECVELLRSFFRGLRAQGQK